MVIEGDVVSAVVGVVRLVLKVLAGLVGVLEIVVEVCASCMVRVVVELVDCSAEEVE